jgi:DNA-binding NtrC family response regulator
LRERPQDILELVEFFLERSCRKNSVRAKRLSAATEQMFLAYSWPGNVRELENTIERTVILTDSETIEPENVPLRNASSAAALPAREFNGPATRTLEDVEKNYMLQVLEETGWQKKRASEILGIDPSTIYRKLLRYGIHPPDER